MIKKLLRNFGMGPGKIQKNSWPAGRLEFLVKNACMTWPSIGIKSAHLVRRSTFPRYQTFPRLWNGREFARYIGFEEKNIFLKIPKHTSISWMLDQAGLGRDKYEEWVLVFRYQHGCFLYFSLYKSYGKDFFHNFAFIARSPNMHWDYR